MKNAFIILAVILIIALIAHSQGAFGVRAEQFLPDTVRVPEFGSPTTTRIYRSPVAGGIIQQTIVPNMRYTYRVSPSDAPQSCDLCTSCYICPSCPRCQVSPE